MHTLASFEFLEQRRCLANDFISIVDTATPAAPGVRTCGSNELGVYFRFETTELTRGDDRHGRVRRSRGDT